MTVEDNYGEFEDAENYDIEEKSDEGDAAIDFYMELAQQTGGPILDIACGTGRVAIPLARAGFEVTGIDIVPAMLEQARRKSVGLPITYVDGDARDFHLDTKFRMAFLTGNAFMMFLTRADQEGLLARVREHLAPGGLLAFETRNPLWAMPKARPFDSATYSVMFERDGGFFANLETDEEETVWESYIDAQGREVTIANSQVWDHVNQWMTWKGVRRWQENGAPHERTSHITVRYTFPQELQSLLHYNCFDVLHTYGDWDKSPLTGESMNMIVVCRPTS